ncbi:ABC transporter ATP-binding protein [Cognatilysobacter tabacisoli]|uniref:ABC transporter ATP-binding protein n=1 Tax=Cognatilysobacter tabacisoli TaxID=2315424 RepID=UPI000E6B3702|nr:ABC transporter ATP-binding protein [Lysobacter tabacisoli]
MPSPSPTHAVRTHALAKSFGAVAAVDGLHLAVPAGSVFGFLGPNGAGKTTTIRLLLGLVRPDDGRIELAGHDLHRERAQALSGVGAIVEAPALYPNLTGRENLRVGTHLLQRPAAVVDELLALVALRDAADRPVRGYSLGMRQRLALARALVGQPRLLILDEPTNGLDPAGITQMRALIRELPARFGTTVLLSSHLLSEIEQTADHCALVDAGRLVYQGPLDRLLQRATPRIRVETDDPGTTLAWFRERGFEAVADGDSVHALADLDAGERAALTAALVHARVGVSGLSVDRPGLEALFLQMTRASEVPA